MALKHFTIKLSDLAKESSFRTDVDFLKSYISNRPAVYYTFSQLFDFVERDSVAVDKLENFLYCEIGHVDGEGEVSPVLLNTSDRHELNENYFKKIENGDILSVLEGDILISSVRPNLKKFVHIDKSKQDIFFTKAFLHLRPKINSKIIFYALRTIFFDDVVSLSRQGKGYPTLKKEDLKFLRFEKNLIDALVINESDVLNEILCIEKQISDCNAMLVKSDGIIDAIFARKFSVNLEEVRYRENSKIYTQPFSEISLENNDLRMSCRWFKYQGVKKILHRNIRCVEQLGKHILQTKNGWSPQCNESESESGLAVLGIDSIKNSHINFGNLKYTDQTKNNIQNYFVSQGDFFLSRGNTVDLVALAGVVEEEVEANIIYPDLMIKVDFDNQVHKQYMAYVFNSFFGRLYFKYVTKGKNQTMVKVSSSELLMFDVPLPDISRQKIIVNEINDQLNERQLIQAQIKEKRASIATLIENKCGL